MPSPWKLEYKILKSELWVGHSAYIVWWCRSGRQYITCIDHIVYKYCPGRQMPVLIILSGVCRWAAAFQFSPLAAPSCCPPKTTGEGIIAVKHFVLVLYYYTTMPCNTVGYHAIHDIVKLLLWNISCWLYIITWLSGWEGWRDEAHANCECGW